MPPIKLDKSLDVVFSEIEQKFDFKNITANKVPVWQFLRNIAYSRLLFPYSTGNPPALSKVKKLLSLTSFLSRPKPSRYVLFTDRYELVRKNSDVFVDKISQNIINTLNEDLLVVISEAQGFKGRIENAGNYLNASYFHLKRRLWPLNNISHIKGVNELMLAFKELGLGYSKYQLETQVCLFFIYCSIFDAWLSKVGPKAVFINCSYSLFHQSLIYSCNIRKIKTIEMQHGLISEEHIQYSPSSDIGKDTFPKYLLTFSNYHSKFINDNFIKSANIFAIGHYFREYKNNYPSNSCLELCRMLRKKYNKIILVSSQKIIEPELCKVVNYLAEKQPDYVFVFKQRQISNLAFEHPNIIIDQDYNTYDFINLIDVNLSCFSTTVLEFLSHKTIGVLMDFNSLASNYFAKIKKDCGNIFICKTRKEALRALSFTQRNYKNVELYKKNNKDNIKSFLNGSVL